MIQIKPNIDHEMYCLSCSTVLSPERVLWQGIHVCAVSICPACRSEIVDDFQVGHAEMDPCRVNMTTGELLINNSYSRRWFGKPFLESLQNPRDYPGLTLKVEKFRDCKEVLILDCIDFLYGHSLLKLLNAEAYLNGNKELGLVLLIPPFLRWMVPSGVAEIWTAKIPLAKARNYYLQFNQLLTRECERFETIFLGRAHSHPKDFTIERFTGVEKHNFDKGVFRITFVWREDRPWLDGWYLPKIVSKLGIARPFLVLQNRRVRRLFSLMRHKFPHAIYTVAGLGTTTKFPSWIDDQRVRGFDENTEKKLCEIYAESRQVIGVHGSNMLLPSAHAGLTLDLMPITRWGNMVQDILYQVKDSRMASHTYQYIPIGTRIDHLAHIASIQLEKYRSFRKWMVDMT